MASDGKIPSKTLISIDRAVDVWEIVDVSANSTNKTTVNNALGITGNPLGDTDSQTVSNKTLGNSNAITVKDGGFTLNNSSDTSKVGVFSLANNTTATTRTYTFPNASVTLASLTGTETLTNKTLTSPVVNTPTITNASITADAYTGFSSANTGTIFGISVTSSKIPGTSLTNATVGPNQLATGAQNAAVATSQTTTSTSYADLGTVGPSVTVTIGANGLALVILSCEMTNDTSAATSYMGFVASGANTIAAANARALFMKNSTGAPDSQVSWAYMATGLATGSTTFKAQYQVSAGTGTFVNRNITVVPL